MEAPELVVLASLPLVGGTELGFSRAVDVLIQQTHVINRRVAAALVWPLTDEHAEQSDDVTSSASGNTTNDSPMPGDVTNGDRTPHDIINGDPSSPDVTNGDPTPPDVTNGDATPPDVTNGDAPPVGVSGGGSLPDEASRLLCGRLGVGSAAAVADCATLTAVCGGGGPGAGRRLVVRKVVPRQAGADAEWDLVVTDPSSVAFVPLQDHSRLIPPFSHRLELSSDAVRLLAPPSASDAPSARWLSEQALPKVVRWTVDMAAESARPPPEGSLQLVDTERYNTLYKQLKSKYGAEFVKIWPENTDPLKFVHEDVAIASYLLLLWEDDRRRLGLQRRQSFVDIGCGNGLLVHILCSEGHPGFGIDIRSRAIWRLYPETTRLEVGTVTPSAETTYPGSDWLIGNHSDELTPWVPVMAAATGPQTSFFLLPCCPWDFYSKYQRADTRLSQYEEYMRYVFRLAERCGFAPERDRLRIPSTRRRCVVGRCRAADAAVTAADLRSLTAAGAVAFRPRAAVPPVRNCTQLPGDTAAAAVRQVALRLAGDAADGASVAGEQASLTLPAVAALLGGDTLRRLRQQCGGLKTLLKNHAPVFNVRGDRVTLQGADWLRADLSRPELAAALKTSRCWQYDHLPAGCPLPADQCRYAHGEQELRSRPPRPRPPAVA